MPLEPESARVEAPTPGAVRVKSGPRDARTPLPLPSGGKDGVAMRLVSTLAGSGQKPRTTARRLDAIANQRRECLIACASIGPWWGRAPIATASFARWSIRQSQRCGGWRFDFGEHLESNWGAVYGGALAAGAVAVARCAAPGRSPRSAHLRLVREKSTRDDDRRQLTNAPRPRPGGRAGPRGVFAWYTKPPARLD